jgi:hypothetical protein
MIEGLAAGRIRRRLEPMSEDAMEESLSDIGPALPETDTNGEIVHWMDKRGVSVGPLGVSAAALGGFALGVAATLAVLAFTDIVDPLVTVRRRRTAADV